MANFGFLENMINMVKHNSDNIYTGPINDSTININSYDSASYVQNSDGIQVAYGSKKDFIWGQKWGNSKTKVAK